MSSNPFLYDYQMDAVSRMSNGCILNGGVGSGKFLKLSKNLKRCEKMFDILSEKTIELLAIFSIGFLVFCCALCIVVAVSWLVDTVPVAIRTKKLKRLQKNRFNKPPTAMCYCVDCCHRDEYGYCSLFEPVPDSMPSETLLYVAEDWFCKDAMPKTLYLQETLEEREKELNKKWEHPQYNTKFSFDSWKAASDLIINLNQMIEVYGEVSIADVYDLMNIRSIRGDYMANLYGWVKPMSIEITTSDGKFGVDLPEVASLFNY